MAKMIDSFQGNLFFSENLGIDGTAFGNMRVIEGSVGL